MYAMMNRRPCLEHTEDKDQPPRRFSNIHTYKLGRRVREGGAVGAGELVLGINLLCLIPDFFLKQSCIHYCSLFGVSFRVGISPLVISSTYPTQWVKTGMIRWAH